MYCKKCNFTSHDHLQACPKCGASWEDERKELGLAWLTEPGGVWLEPAAGQEHSFELEPDFPDEEPLFMEGPVEDAGIEPGSGKAEVPEALRDMDLEITAPADSIKADEEGEIPEALQGMDMRITDPADTLEPVQEEGDIEFPGLADPLPRTERSTPPPQQEAAPDAEEIIGVDFSLDDDIFEDIEDILIPDSRENKAEPAVKAVQTPPPADIEFADLLDLEELLVPREEKK